MSESESVIAEVLPPGIAPAEGVEPTKKPRKASSKAKSKATALAIPDEKVQELETLRAACADDLKQVQNFPLDTPEQAEILNQVCLNAKAEQERLEVEMKKITDPLDAAKKQVKALFGPPIEFLKSIRAAGKLRLEQALNAQREQRAAALAAMNAAQGRVDATVLATATAPVLAPPSGSYEVEEWHYEVTDPTKLPISAPDGTLCWILNDTGLKMYAKAHKDAAATGAMQIPGVRFYATRRLVQRSQT